MDKIWNRNPSKSEIIGRCLLSANIILVLKIHTQIRVKLALKKTSYLQC